MKTKILRLFCDIPSGNRINSTISLQPFINFLEEKVSGEDGGLTPFLRLILEQIEKIAKGKRTIALDEVRQYAKIFELVYYTFTTPISDETKEKWAIGQPFSWNIFFGTDAFYRMLIRQHKTGKTTQHQKGLSVSLLKRKKIIYGFLLKRLYQFSYFEDDAIIYSFPDKKTGLDTYFKVAIDTRFINLKYEGILPDLYYSDFEQNQFDIEKNMATLEKVLPLHKFTFQGFSLIHIKDVTNTYIVEHIKDNIVTLAAGQQVPEDVSYYLKTLLRDNAIDVKLFPVKKVNGRVALSNIENFKQLLHQHCEKFDFDQQRYRSIIEAYTKNPQLIFYPDVEAVKEGSHPEILSFLQKSCIRSFMLVPILFNKNLVGVIELLSEKKNALTEQSLVRLNLVMPLLENLMKTIDDEFKLSLDNVIKEHFTTIHASVRWRFNEAAWRFMERREKNDKAEMEHIYFKDVYPLYGDIDVKESTLKRNEAVKKDISSRLESFLEIGKHYWEEKTDLNANGLWQEAEIWSHKIGEAVDVEKESYITNFFEEKADPFLEQLRKKGGSPKMEQQIKDYFWGKRPYGKFNENRRRLEEGFRRLNRKIRKQLDRMNSRVQEIYPSYFEKFRTDGLEYDIYVGQSITPQRPFKASYLRKIRKIQLNTMVEVARETHQVEMQLFQKLKTTQLIYVNPGTISINFRNDERRFDVEGERNIHYEIAKKRIDKAVVRESGERLSQPGKIAIVYLKQNDIVDYVSFIKELQKEGALARELEYLYLNDLQGLANLKALRVSILF